MKTEVQLLGQAEHVRVVGTVDLPDLHVLLARRVTNKAIPMRDLFLDFRDADLTVSALEISTFIDFLASDLLKRLGTHYLTVASSRRSSNHHWWGKVGNAAILGLADSHPRFDVVHDVVKTDIAA
ncbi:MAG: hypothetical protein E2O59_07365 [Gammaproteobacteria bacterium]|nr:MAG: hypothetical protein E2O59_07365 [Gammaproteobacteria bacterium]